MGGKNTPSYLDFVRHLILHTDMHGIKAIDSSLDKGGLF
jgi:hypothetical protein